MTTAESLGVPGSLTSHARSIAVFFLFAMPDESFAAHSAERAISALKASNLARAEGRPARVRLVQLCKRRYQIEVASWRRDRGDRVREAAAPAAGQTVGLWRFPSDANVSAWLKFRKDTGEDELLALIFSRILKLSDDEVAEGLAISSGTLRHRLGRAARSLGHATVRSRSA